MDKKIKNIGMSEEEFERQFVEATKRGERILSESTKAIAASYDRETKRLVIDLDNSMTILFPVKFMQGLSGASDDEIAEVEIWGKGLYLHWEKLDADFQIANLMRGIFGTKNWMTRIAAEMGKAGGSATTEAKRAASRENGKKGGRPPKQNKAA